MLKFVGFMEQSGHITDERTGEARPWSNRFIRCVTDTCLEPGNYGYVLVENKIKTADLARNLGINFKPSDIAEPAFEEQVNTALKSMFHKDIEWSVSIVKGSAEVTGFRVIPSPIQKPGVNK